MALAKTLTIALINIGSVRAIGHRGEGPVWSGFNKTPIDRDYLYLTSTGLAGDQQADTSIKRGKQVHGGHEKALYFYPIVHYGLWERDLGRRLFYPSFGENVTLAGQVDEDKVCIGDVWSWGDDGVQIRITKPRRPCFKVNMVFGRDDMITRMRDTGRCGWYCEVLQPGQVPTVGRLKLVSREEGALTVAQAFQEKVDKDGSTW